MDLSGSAANLRVLLDGLYGEKSDLERRTEKVTEAIKDTEHLLAKIEILGVSTAIDDRERTPVGRDLFLSWKGSSVTTRDAITAILGSEDRAFSTSEVIGKTEEFGSGAAPDTVRSYLSRMAKSGEITQVRRGQYRLPSLEPDETPSKKPEQAAAQKSALDADLTPAATLVHAPTVDHGYSMPVDVSRHRFTVSTTPRVTFGPTRQLPSGNPEGRS